MSNVLIETSNMDEAVEFERSLGPGLYNVSFQTDQPLTEDILDRMAAQLDAHNIQWIELGQTGTYPNTVFVKYKRIEDEGIGFAWAAVLPLIVPLAIVGAVVFGIIKIEDITRNLVPLLLIAGGLMIVLVSIQKEAAGDVIRRSFG